MQSTTANKANKANKAHKAHKAHMIIFYRHLGPSNHITKLCLIPEIIGFT